MAARATIGIKLTEEDNKLIYELRSAFGYPIKVCINKDNYIAKTIKYKKPGDKEFDTLLAATIIGISKSATTNDTIAEYPNGSILFDVVYSINGKAPKRVALFSGGLKSKVTKTLQLEG